jgi:predicted transcriptional regulator
MIPIIENLDAVLRVLTPENRRLLALIYQERPRSVRALSELSGMAQPNVSRALSNLSKAGLVKLVGEKPKRPELVTDIVIIDITGTNHYAGAE